MSFTVHVRPSNRVPWQALPYSYQDRASANAAAVQYIRSRSPDGSAETVVGSPEPTQYAASLPQFYEIPEHSSGAVLWQRSGGEWEPVREFPSWAAADAVARLYSAHEFEIHRPGTQPRGAKFRTASVEPTVSHNLPGAHRPTPDSENLRFTVWVKYSPKYPWMPRMRFTDQEEARTWARGHFANHAWMCLETGTRPAGWATVNS